MKISTLSGLLLLLPTALSAQQTWTYSQCVNYARENNISLQQARLNAESSLLNLEAAQGQWLPTLQFSTTHGLTNTPWANSGDETTYGSNYGLNVGWTVWNGGERSANIKRQKALSQASSFTALGLETELEHDILQIYINLLYSRETININREAATLSKAQEERARQLMESGKLSRVDYAQIAAQAEQDSYSLVSAEGNYASQCTELKRLLELGFSDRVEPAQVNWTREEVLASLSPLDESYRMAILADNTLKASQLQADAAELEAKIAKTGRMPQISLNAGIGSTYYAPGGSFGSQLKHGFNENISISVSVPILDQKKTKTAVAQAKISKLDADLTREGRLTDIGRDIEALYTDVRSAQSRYIAGEKQVEAAALSNDLVNEQFSLGLVNPVELLTAHNALTSAKRELTQAKYMTMLGKKRIEIYRNNTTTL